MGVADGVDDQPGQIDRLAFQRPSGVQPRQQQHVLDELRHPFGFGFAPGSSRARRRRAGRLVCVAPVRYSRESRPAGCVVRGWRRRRTGVPASRWRAARTTRRRCGRASGSARSRAGRSRCARLAGSTLTIGVGSRTSPRSSSRSATCRAAAETLDSGASWRRMMTTPAVVPPISAIGADHAEDDEHRQQVCRRPPRSATP